MGSVEHPTSLLPDILPDLDGKVVPAYTPLEEFAIVESWEDKAPPEATNKWYSIYHKQEEQAFHPETISGDEITIEDETSLDIQVGDKCRLEYIYNGENMVVDVLEIVNVEVIGSDTVLTVDRELEDTNINFPVLYIYPRNPPIESHTIMSKRIRLIGDSYITSGLRLEGATTDDYNIADTLFIYNTEMGWIYEVADVIESIGGVTVFVYGQLMSEIKVGDRVANITNFKAQHGIKFMDQVLLVYYDGEFQINARYNLNTGILMHPGDPLIPEDKTGLKLGYGEPYRSELLIPYNAFLMQCRNREVVEDNLDWVIYFIRGLLGTEVANKYEGTQLKEFGSAFLDHCKNTIRHYIRKIAPASYEVDYAYYHGAAKDEDGSDPLSSHIGRPFGGTQTILLQGSQEPVTTEMPTTTGI